MSLRHVWHAQQDRGRDFRDGALGNLQRYILVDLPALANQLGISLPCIFSRVQCRFTAEMAKLSSTRLAWAANRPVSRRHSPMA